mgnify:CR=1 FL=1
MLTKFKKEQEEEENKNQEKQLTSFKLKLLEKDFLVGEKFKLGKDIYTLCIAA